MVDSNYTHIAVVVDRSGSMSTIQNDMIGALDTFFKEQAEVDPHAKVLVDYAQFDDQYEKVFSDTDIKKAKAQLQPRGLTALLDGIGKTITDLGTKLKALPEAHRPGKVLVVIITDGGENASREYKQDTVKKLIQQQESEYDWSFLFLGANIDAVAVGASFGLSRGSTLTYDTANVDNTIGSLSMATSAYRGAPLGAKAGFSEEDREAAVKS